MKIIFPSFAILVCLGAMLCAQVVEGQGTGGAPPATAAAPTPEGAPVSGATGQDPNALVQQMSAAIAAQRSISARIRLRADLFANQMIGAGVYLQQGLGAERQLRLEIKIPVGDRMATLQQVCDGNFLWQYHDLAEKPALTRVDIHRVQQALERGASGKNVPDLRAGFPYGGLPQLVESLRQSFRFTRMQPGQLDSLPVWVVAGSWRPEALAPISPDLAKQASEGRPLDLKKLPPQMPEEVLLYVGQDDLFPYRIEYRRRATRQGKQAIAEGNELLPILVVELYEVRLNGAIDPQQFAYQPGNLEVLDTTEQMLKSLGVK